jgi:hypothetical protein
MRSRTPLRRYTTLDEVDILADSMVEAIREGVT